MDAAKIACALLLTLAGLATPGCSGMRHVLDRPFREPGEKLWAFPDKVWSEYECDRKELPFFEIEHLELYPKRLHPGDEFGHRLVYALCPERLTGVVTGELQTRILHRGQVIVEDRTPSYDLKPGRWVVDTFVRLPQSADVGIYAFEFAFQSPSVSFARSFTFAVDPGEAPAEKPEEKTTAN
jgi:hypothetical protein